MQPSTTFVNALLYILLETTCLYRISKWNTDIQHNVQHGNSFKYIVVYGGLHVNGGTALSACSTVVSRARDKRQSHIYTTLQAILYCRTFPTTIGVNILFIEAYLLPNTAAFRRQNTIPLKWKENNLVCHMNVRVGTHLQGAYMHVKKCNSNIKNVLILEILKWPHQMNLFCAQVLL